MSVALPVACTLSSTDLRAAREHLLPGLVALSVAHDELPRGMRFHFAPTAERLRHIADVARREGACCEFLEFKVSMALGEASLTLDVTGPAGTKSFLSDLLGVRAAA